MLKMQKIQPLMRTLQDKFKKLKANDPRRQEVQTEMMGLYKKHGVNPMGGCLPNRAADAVPLRRLQHAQKFY